VSGYGLEKAPSLNGPLLSALHAIVTNSALVISLSGLYVLSGYPVIIPASATASITPYAQCLISVSLNVGVIGYLGFSLSRL